MRSKSKVKRTASAKPDSTFNELVQGYNNLVSSLLMIKKHRPFASVDNLPKICQPEDNQDINFPKSSSEEEASERSSDEEQDGSNRSQD